MGTQKAYEPANVFPTHRDHVYIAQVIHNRKPQTKYSLKYN